MNKLDVSSPAFSLSPASDLDASTRSESAQRPGPAPRLIVLVPASEPDTQNLENRIWEIARSLQLHVLLLSLTNDFDEEAQLRRKLITMAAMIKDPHVSTGILIEHGNDWVGQVKKLWRKGDIVACYANQKVGIMRKALDEILRSSLNMPVYILANARPVKNSRSTRLSRFFFWVGALGILSGFFWAEANLVQLPQDWAHTALIYVCVLIEIGALAFWNSLFT
ncbi:MAG: hypothetical protein HYZ24_14230 [Chloroflexi bacterium]|nr:hypothetical protein [Chloroflexota bacterium]